MYDMHLAEHKRVANFSSNGTVVLVIHKARDRYCRLILRTILTNKV